MGGSQGLRKGNGEFCLTRTEYQLGKMRRVLKMDGGSCCPKLWMYLMPLDCTLVKLVTFMFMYILPPFFKKEIIVYLGWWNSSASWLWYWLLTSTPGKHFIDTYTPLSFTRVQVTTSKTQIGSVPELITLYQSWFCHWTMVMWDVTSGGCLVEGTQEVYFYNFL